MQLFHLGFLYQRPVTVNIIRDGVPTPVPYQRELFDYGRNKIERTLPVNLGFAGFRLHYPLNDPKVLDELIAFLGASYFRFLGSEQKYGLSARGLAINVKGGEAEEFPHFREFWIEMPKPNDERAIVYALLDSPSVAGAYRFDIYPSKETTLDVTATLFPRQTISNVGVAPLTSMFFEGENDRKPTDDYRLEIHDSDGLLMQSGAGEWIWRPLRNPNAKTISSFSDNNPRGFGLMQRDRVFENYQDLEASYHQRPGYWVEPIGQWGEGWVELVEIPTPDETHDNIVAYWQPNRAFESCPIACAPPRRSAPCIRAARWSTPSRRLPGRADRTRRAIPGTAASSSTSRAAICPTISARRSRCSWCPPPRSARSPTPSSCPTTIRTASGRPST
jgi:glucans biosynthesis protein